MLQLFFLCLVCILATISLIDIKTHRIPDWLNFLLGALGIAFAFSGGVTQLKIAFFGLLLGFALTMSIRQFFFWHRGYHGLGLGDVKMVSAASLWLGIEGVPTMLLIASISGIASLAIFSISNKSAIVSKKKLPFGPYLALGIISTWILQNYI